MESILNLSNVKCAGCVNKIESRVKLIPGILDARVNLLDKTLYLVYQDKNLDQEVMVQLKVLGYPATREAEADNNKSLTRIILPLMLGILLMFGSIFPDYISRFLINNSQISGFIYSILSLVVIIVCGYNIIEGGINGIRTLNLNMYSLIIIGVFSAWGYSTFIVFADNFAQPMHMVHSYFESSLIIIGLVNLGALLEERAKTNAGESLRKLTELLPETATLIKDSTEQVIATNRLRTGDLIKIRPGEKLPADGVITAGNGYLDEAMLSGEPLPVHKKSGDNVFGGSINVSGSFIFQVTRAGANTLLGDIIQLVKTAQLAKPRLARLADNVAKFFIPVVILVAVISSVIWYFAAPMDSFSYAIKVFMTILIIACPCSVGLAIPVSLAVGIGRAARAGIIIRDSSGLDIVDQISTIIVDKTGTVTEGKPQVVAVEMSDAYNREAIFAILKSLEINSEHPLAKAIVDFVPANLETPVREFKSYSGQGVSGIIDEVEYVAGSLAFVLNGRSDQNPLISKNQHTNVYLADQKQIIARIDISDVPKADSAEAISKLYAAGFNVLMLTGDNQQNAEFIAGQVGIQTIIADCLPRDKVNKIIELQNQGEKVLFVGDGINDAPSLAQADLGIAIGGASDIARQNASISLLGNSLSDVSSTISLVTKIKQNMRQNLFGAFAYNTVAILVASGALYPIWAYSYCV